MKNTIKHLAIITVLFLLGNCKSKTTEPQVQNNQNNQDKLKRVWMLVEFQNFKKEDLIKHEAQLNLTDLKNPTAKMGCNRISLQIESKENSIKFSNLMSTKMFCVDKMDLETAFIKSLPEFNSYSNQGQKLILENSKAEKMVFVAQDWD
jgi:heat shock protein HslJ